MVPELVLADRDERDDLGAFVARAVRLDPQAVVRLRNRPSGDSSSGEPVSTGLVDAWVATPFDALATRTVAGRVTPGDLTVSANDLLTGLAVVRSEVVDPGPARDMMWRSALPPVAGWLPVDRLPGSVVSELAEKGVAVARENAGPRGTPPASLLDQTVITVSGSGLDVKVPMRCLFALSGMGFLGGDDVRVTATDSWLRIDARFGAVVRRRHSMLPLLV